MWKTKIWFTHRLFSGDPLLMIYLHDAVVAVSMGCWGWWRKSNKLWFKTCINECRCVFLGFNCNSQNLLLFMSCYCVQAMMIGLVCQDKGSVVFNFFFCSFSFSSTHVVKKENGINGQTSYLVRVLWWIFAKNEMKIFLS